MKCQAIFAVTQFMSFYPNLGSFSDKCVDVHDCQGLLLLTYFIWKYGIDQDVHPIIFCGMKLLNHALTVTAVTVKP